MSASAGMAPSRPPTIEELVAQAEQFSFNINMPLKLWIRSAETTYQEATFALSDGDYGRAYVMLYRYSTLVIKCLGTHPEFKNPEGRRAVKPLTDGIGRVIQELEELRPKIKRAHEEWERMAPKREVLEPRKKEQSSARSYADFAARDPTLSGNAKILDASQHQELAVDLAQEELDRRDELRRSRREALNASRSQTAVLEDSDLQRQIEETRSTLDRARQGVFEESQSSNFPVSTSNKFNYPSISRSQPVDFGSLQEPLAPQLPPKPQLNQPQRPPKDLLPTPLSQQDGTSQSYAIERPLLPPKAPLSGPEIPKKERLAFKPGAYLENGDPIRSLFIPSKLRQSFLEVAAKNTAAGLEMCGMLCGTPVNNALFVRCLLIPDQKCTSDTCDTENEGTMFDYCMNEDLLILGWIHTHPTQTCFMSSRDLHTQAGHQALLPESVAIVCAPKFSPSYGIFRLTHPPGLDHILACKKTETFHQHSITNLYCESEHPHGHVYESDKMPFYVHDLRTK